MHWLAPKQPGSAPITAYVVTPFSGGKPGSPRMFKSRNTTQVVGGLKNGRTYAFKVAARSNAGTSVASKPSIAIVIGAPTAPRRVAGLAQRQGRGELDRTRRDERRGHHRVRREPRSTVA